MRNINTNSILDKTRRPLYIKTEKSRPAQQYRENETQVLKEEDTNKKQVQVHSHQRLLLRCLRRKECRLELLQQCW